MLRPLSSLIGNRRRLPRSAGSANDLRGLNIRLASEAMPNARQHAGCRRARDQQRTWSVNERLLMLPASPDAAVGAGRPPVSLEELSRYTYRHEIAVEKPGHGTKPSRDFLRTPATNVHLVG